MVLKNWYKCLAAYVYGGTAEVKYKNYLGDECSYESASHVYGIQFGLDSTSTTYTPTMKKVITSELSGSSAGVIFGTGNEEPTSDDYCLSGEQVTGFVYSSAVTKTADDDGITLTGVYTITNNNATDITISEIGLIGNYNGNANTAAKLMVERSLLDTPVTIPAGGVGQVTYTIRMNYPT